MGNAHRGNALEPPRTQPEGADRPPDPLPTEARIIARLLAHGHRGSVPLRVPPGDDAAVLADGTVLTTDLLIEGVHFDGRLSADDVGWKAVAVSVSDVAAMGARPTWMLLDLATGADDDWVAGFARGLESASVAFDVDLIGGDTTGTSGPRVVCVTMAGIGTGAPLRRGGAHPGDRVLVTGVPGLAAAGYLHAAPHPDALAALRRPAPPLAFAQAAAPLLTAAMDLSDGLAADLPRLARASGVGARVDPAALPDHAALHGDPVPARTLQLAGGDDYALLVTAAPAAVPRLLALAASHGVLLSDIGEITQDRDVGVTDGSWPAPPWRHFGGDR